MEIENFILSINPTPNLTIMKQKIDVKGWGRGFLKKKRKVNKKFDSDVQSDVDNLICQKSITKIISVRGFH